MLEKPDIRDERIMSRVLDEYGLQSIRLDFLPLGADVHTAVFRLDATDGRSYFLKLRSSDFYEITVTLPEFLKEQGLRSIIAPLKTKTGRYWSDFDEYKLILYPFIDGKDAYEVELTNVQWREFGAALKSIHSTRLPPELERQVPVEDFSPLWRKLVRRFQEQVVTQTFREPVAAKLADFMKFRREEITNLVDRAAHLAGELQSGRLELVLCHSDIHAGNLHITPDGTLYIVDWDNPVHAPKERDLMHFGGSPVWTSRHAALFYQGYGSVDIDMKALAYYRYERIIQDIAEFCKQLLLTDEGGKNRQQSLKWFTGQFLPGHEVEVAFRTDKFPR